MEQIIDKKSGQTYQEQLEYLASKGDGSASEELHNIPVYPQEIDRLMIYAERLHGRSGLSFTGVNPLAPSELTLWAQGIGIWPLHPWEFEALLDLTDALLYRPPKEGDSETSGEDEVTLGSDRISRRKPVRWPKRKS